MSFFDEIIKDGDIKDSEFSLKITIVDNRIIAIDGCSKILVLGREEIVFEIKKNQSIRITGSDFSVSQLGKNEFVVSGNIGGVFFV